jgi:hypothetical protein
MTVSHPSETTIFSCLIHVNLNYNTWKELFVSMYNTVMFCKLCKLCQRCYALLLAVLYYLARMEETRNAHNILVGKPEGKRSGFGWEDRIALRKQWEGVDWMDLAQDRDQWRIIVTTVMNLRFLKRQGISWLSDFSISRSTLLHGVS